MPESYRTLRFDILISHSFSLPDMENSYLAVKSFLIVCSSADPDFHSPDLNFLLQSYQISLWNLAFYRPRASSVPLQNSDFIFFLSGPVSQLSTVQKSAWLFFIVFCFLWIQSHQCDVYFQTLGCPDFSMCKWAHGVVVSHPLCMRKALGSIPSVSICFSWVSSLRESKYL